MVFGSQFLRANKKKHGKATSPLVFIMSSIASISDAPRKRKSPDEAPVGVRLLETETDESVAEKIRAACLASKDEFTSPPLDFDDLHEVSTRDFMNSTIQEQIDYIERASWVDTHDNVSTPVLKWFADNSAIVARDTPARTRSFDLTYGQRAAIYYFAYGTPVKVSYGYELNREAASKFLEDHYLSTGGMDNPLRRQEAINRLKLRNKQIFRMKTSETTSIMSLSPETMPPVFRIACLPMGLGKTVISVFSAVLALCTAKGRQISDMVYAQKSREVETGFRRETEIDLSKTDQKKVAPLFVFFVPKHMEAHWEQTMYDCLPEVSRLREKGVLLSGDVQIWRGTPQREESQSYSVHRCYSEDKSTLWILPLVPASLDVLYASPDIAVSGVIYDEMDTNISKVGNKARSIIAGPVIIAQATIESLTVHFRNQQKNNFLQNIVGYQAMKDKDAMNRSLKSGDYGDISRSLTCSARLHLCMPSAKFMQMVAGASVHKMPRGITSHSITSRKSVYDVLCYGYLRERDLSSIIINHLQRRLEPFVTATSQLRQKLSAVSYVRMVHGHQVVDFVAIKEPLYHIADELFPNVGPTLYDVLGVDPDSWSIPIWELEAAKKKAQIKWHPDKHPHDIQNATEMFKKIGQAFDTLSDYTKKSQYDQEIYKTRKVKDFVATLDRFFSDTIAKFATCEKCRGTAFRFYSDNDNMHCVTCRPVPASSRNEIFDVDFTPPKSSPPISGRDAVTSLLVQCLRKPRARVVLFCNEFSDGFLAPLAKTDGLGKLEMLTFPKGCNKNKRAQNIARFSTPHEHNPVPMLMVMSKAEIRGSDLKNVTAVVMYGHTEKDERKQVIGRCLRMSNNPRDSSIPVYEIV